MKKQKKITLSASRNVPFSKLMLSQSNMRHVKVGMSIEELVDDIARRTLLNSLRSTSSAPIRRSVRRFDSKADIDRMARKSAQETFNLRFGDSSNANCCGETR